MRHRLGPDVWKRFGVVLLSVAGSSGVAFGLKTLLHGQAHLLPFTLAVIASSWYGGLIPGLAATILSVVIADYFFIEPLFHIEADSALLAVFLVVGVSISLLQKALAKTNAALRESHRRIELASKELVRSNEELQRFAYSVAHDLQEPLRTIRSFTELFLTLNRNTLNAKSIELLDFVLNGSDRMKRLIQDVLEFAAVSHEPNATDVPVNTHTVVEAAVQQLRKAIDETGARISLDSLPTISANEAQLLRLFQNLIGNAIKYRGENSPEIHVGASLNTNNEWVFSVRDNGIGIDPRYHDQIFETFQRLHSNSEYEGSGVGLATCRRIVQRHGGRIWVESEPGKGSTFYFTIPNDSGPAEVAEAADGIQRKPTRKSDPGDGQSHAVAG
ncbi:MAG: hypothetical protein DMG59_08035 [Acidobacteria bacterium]|nr:MAG: hypothetical protein DMG59_08035 [Acidobacteriota bacterium]